MPETRCGAPWQEDLNGQTYVICYYVMPMECVHRYWVCTVYRFRIRDLAAWQVFFSFFFFFFLRKEGAFVFLVGGARFTRETQVFPRTTLTSRRLLPRLGSHTNTLAHDPTCSLSTVAGAKFGGFGGCGRLNRPPPPPQVTSLEVVLQAHGSSTQGFLRTNIFHTFWRKDNRSQRGDSFLRIARKGSE